MKQFNFTILPKRGNLDKFACPYLTLMYDMASLYVSVCAQCFKKLSYDQAPKDII